MRPHKCSIQLNSKTNNKQKDAPSGTEPLIRVMAEAKTDELCAEYVKRVTDFLEANNF